ncbi:Small nuclear ribonucleoprotein Sm D3 [Rasamsonia emersonii CBS 393.64]|uniref:Small nuclear ribonucleoprotein Sm D3 n=1 Tax=Rasamsonia emersonii (strain ATCC 16479 / CBS 393.64 / IMI 116815) TaxID=1408163 RepID=A0A0F4Z3H8_RASE3|nr:Small nuclear ribonucleoprotein Sm D3 [Rasamsonia emersonii CBS 393.64]KKA24890.1 Small nuclear ribonucleoprotein Sm D3 [Rasamsonia emersonii CBS 393.64]
MGKQASTIGIPIKLLNEAQGHVVTLEITSGQVYRGKLLEAEDNMNVQLKDITVTARDGRVSHLDQVYIRGSHVRFFIVPDMLSSSTNILPPAGMPPCSALEASVAGVLVWLVERPPSTGLEDRRGVEDVYPCYGYQAGLNWISLRSTTSFDNYNPFFFSSHDTEFHLNISMGPCRLKGSGQGRPWFPTEVMSS